MSSEEYFDDSDREFDASFLNQVDAIEAAHFSPSRPQTVSNDNAGAIARAEPRSESSEDSFDLTFDEIDEQELQRLEDEAYKKAPPPPSRRAGPSNLSRTGSKGTVQTTLFGDILRPQPKAGPSKPAPSQAQAPSKPPELHRTSSRNPFGHPPRKTKVWDHTEFAKTGWKRSNSKNGKGKGRARDDDEEEEEEFEFEQFPAPFMPGVMSDFMSRPPPSMKLKVDRFEAKTWIYPLNQPKREYQFNIVKHCLFDNTLVALPTGLGKTFIAGVVMLNFYRWFPSGKVVFVAPTRPLVAQQIEACHRTCGIPGSDAVELTGETVSSVRNRMWAQKRVIYMTPQTLMNDLKTENCDARDIVLLVIDEAHKGTGDYAYTQVVRGLMAKNGGHFRVLALTATPGGRPEVVQEVVNSLHISRIEIRDEASIDLRGYMHKKIINQHKITMNEDVVKVRDLLVKLMDEKIKPLKSVGLLYGTTAPTYLQPFKCQLAQREISSRPDARGLSWAYPALQTLGALARAMGYLLESSMRQCYACLQNLANGGEDEEDGRGGPKSGFKKQQQQQRANGIRNHPTFQELMRELESQMSRGFSTHPKMERLKSLILEHFLGQGEEAKETRVMVFASYRDCVEEITEYLNMESPLIKAKQFIGQGVDKQGRKGYGQKEQLGIIQKFKGGEFNVLVATSVGEEGLDIGEVDMVVCYEAQQTPIRMLQRIGRTGRKRDGHIHVLLAENREETNWAKAQEKYEEVQRSIVRGDAVELYADVERLLPDDITPQLAELVMPIEEYVREEKKRTSSTSATASPTKGKKRKRNNDPFRNIPPGAITGFLIARDLEPKKRRTIEDFDEDAGKDDDTDMDIEAGVLAPRRTVSASTASARPPKSKNVLRKSKTVDPNKKAPGTSKRKKATNANVVDSEPTTSQFLRRGEDDSDDQEIEAGLAPSLRARRVPSPSPPFSSKPRQPSSSLGPPLAEDVIDLASSDTSPPGSPTLSRKLERNSPECPLKRTRISYSPSPRHTSRSLSLFRDDASSDVENPALSPRSPDKQARTQDSGQDISWLIDDDEDPAIDIASSSPIRSRVSPRTTRRDVCDESVEIVDEPSPSRPPAQSSPDPLAIIDSPKTSPPVAKMRARRTDMPPPALPARLAPINEEEPEPSFAIRRPVKKRLAVVPDDADSSPLQTRSPVQRLRRLRRSPSPPTEAREVKRKKKRDLVPRKNNPLFDYEAAHSGDDLSQGSSDVNDDPESESDRLFLAEPGQTQVSPSYDQSTIYRRSLLTQAPSKVDGPAFANRPVRRGLYATQGRERRPIVSSSPPRPDDDLPDEYALGSFVVDDDAEITFEGSSSDL